MANVNGTEINLLPTEGMRTEAERYRAWGGDPGQTWSNSKGAAIENAKEDRAALHSLRPDTAAPMEQRDLNREPLRRVASFDGSAVGEESRSLEFSFSSEAPVARWFGDEVLSHDSESVDLTRLNDGAPLLWNHNPDQVLGVVERGWIDGEKKRGMVAVRFSRSAFAEEKLADIRDGILRNVSVGYSINDADQTRDGSIVATSWQPHEVSVVSVPADMSVGIGRQLETTIAAPAADQTPTLPTMETVDLTKERAAAAADAVTAERSRIAAITNLTRDHGADDLAGNLIASGATEADAMRSVLAAIGKRVSQPAAPKAAAAQPIASGGSADIGLSDKEARSFSFLKAMRAQLFPNERAFQEEAAFEREASNAAAQRMGMSPKGILIPNDVLSRSLTAGTASGAGDLIFTDARPGSFIELLRKRNFLTGLGVTILAGLTGPVGIPKQTGASQVYWKGEGVAGTESEPSAGQVTMTLKEMSAWTRFSRSLMLQSSIDVETFVRNDLVTVMALEQARVALYGLGSSSQPEGLKLTTGINTKDFSAGQPTYAELVEMETLVAADDADIGTMGYVTNATIYGGFKTTEKAANTAQFVLEPGGTVNSYGVTRSNQVESGDVFFGVWSQLVLGLFGAVDLQVNPYSEDKEGNIRVVAHQAIDYAVRHPQAFCRGNNTL
jgi:HK97 family phage major capsid protein/HK97 family phage prohead protease